MSELEDLVVSNTEQLFTDTVWKSPQGDPVPMSLYKGRLPDRGAATATGLDAEESEYEEPFVLVREVSGNFGEPVDTASFLLYAQLYDSDGGGRDELRRLAGVLRGLIRSEFYPWSVEEKMSVQYGDEFGNQPDPEFIAMFKLDFYKGT